MLLHNSYCTSTTHYLEAARTFLTFCSTSIPNNFTMPAIKFSGENSPLFDQSIFGVELPEPDVQILTGGLRIPAHSSVLAMASPVLESILERRPRKHRQSEKVIPIHGVKYDAVSVFIRLLYTSRYNVEEVGKNAIHLLALSHVFSVPQLKQKCIKELATQLTTDNVVDLLQLARLCDAPDLNLKCMKLLSEKFRAVQGTEGWKFLQKHDPQLELEILRFIDEIESRRKRTKRHKQDLTLYLQLSEAMECLVHICTEGCTSVGPYDMALTKKEPCSKFPACQGLQQLFKHFAKCQKRVNGGCSRCKRMWQLLRLHASMCDQPVHCKVPLCRQLKMKMQQEKKGDDARWKLLVRKVLSARAIYSLSLPKRKREAEPVIVSLGGRLGNIDL